MFCVKARLASLRYFLMHNSSRQKRLKKSDQQQKNVTGGPGDGGVGKEPKSVTYYLNNPLQCSSI